MAADDAGVFLYTPIQALTQPFPYHVVAVIQALQSGMTRPPEDEVASLARRRAAAPLYLLDLTES